MQSKNNQNKDFSLLDNAVINLIIEKTKLNKDKFSLILSKTVIIYVIVMGLTMVSRVNDLLPFNVIIVALLVSTVLLIIVYVYVIEHFNKMDKDIDEVVSLLQTKVLMNHKKKMLK